MNEPRIVEKIGRTIPNCKLMEIPDASHDLPNENPTFFIRALRGYLTDLSSATDRSTGKNPSEINYEG